MVWYNILDLRYKFIQLDHNTHSNLFSNSYTLFEIKWSESESEVTQPCPTLCDPMDGSLPGSSVHGIFQARILEWAAISFSRDQSSL